MQKKGFYTFLMIFATLLFAISLLMPWFTVVLGHIPGYSLRSYILLIFFIYPLYTVIRNVPIHRTYGLFSAIVPLGVMVVLYFNFTGESDTLDIAIGSASFGFYTAVLASILFLAGVILKLRGQHQSSDE